MNKYQYVLLAPPYDEKNGGSIAMHKLCDLINKNGTQCYIFPYIPVAPIDVSERKEFEENIEKSKDLVKYFPTNSSFNTPVLDPYSYKQIQDNPNIITVYPEITFGNPLKSTNVVRWLLNSPGKLRKRVYYESGEIYFRYANIFEGINISGSVLSDNFLNVLHVPFEHFNQFEIPLNRANTCYAIRKGKGRNLVHDITKSTLIDYLDWEETAKIFKSSHTFYCYDTRSFYIQLAALCGCKSIVIPEENIDFMTWSKGDQTLRYGISYGLEDNSLESMNFSELKNLLEIRQGESNDSVRNFTLEVENYFNNKAS